MTLRPTLFLAAALAVSGCDALGGSDSASVDPGLFPAVQNGDRVLIDREGRVVVDLDGYNDVHPGGEGLVPARRWSDGRSVWDFFDESGEVAFTVAADEAYAPRGKRARVRIDGLYAFVDTDGRFLVNPYLRSARDFSENVARIRTTSGDYGFMDRDGQVVAETDFDELGDVRDGRARFVDDGKVGFADAQGAVAIAAAYDDAREFSGGRAAVRQGTRWFYVDQEDGRPLGSATFLSAGDFAEDRAPVRSDANLWEYIDGSGARVIEPQFTEARAFAEGRAAVEIDGRWTFIRPDGSQIAPPSFDEVEDFAGGLAQVTVVSFADGDERVERGYIDEEGEYVWFPRD